MDEQEYDGAVESFRAAIREVLRVGDDNPDLTIADLREIFEQEIVDAREE